jgi:hypothetical protein
MMTHQNVRADLPWFINGSQAADEFQSLESELARWPLLEGEVAWLRGVRNNLRLQRYFAGAERSDTAGLDALMALVHGEQSGRVVPLRKRVSNWVSTPGRFKVAMGIAASVVLAQAAVIGILIDQKEAGRLAPLSGAVVVKGAQLQVTFKVGTTELQIRSVLTSVKGEIVAGPGALGVYTIRVPEGQGTNALDRLKKSNVDIIDTAVALPGR